MSPYRGDSAEDLRRQLAQQVLDVGDGCRHDSMVGRPEHGPHLGCSSAWPRAGCRRRLGGDLDRPGLGLDVDEPVAGEELLRLGERPVRHHRGARPVGHDDLGVLGPASPLPPTSSPASLSSRPSAFWNSMWRVTSSGSQVVIGGNAVDLVAHQDHVLHDLSFGHRHALFGAVFTLLSERA